MAESPAFMVANFTIEDADTYRKYEKGFFPVLKKHGGEFITFDDSPNTFEGSAPPPGRLVIFSFPSELGCEGRGPYLRLKICHRHPPARALSYWAGAIYSLGL